MEKKTIFGKNFLKQKQLFWILGIFFLKTQCVAFHDISPLRWYTHSFYYNIQ